MADVIPFFATFIIFTQADGSTVQRSGKKRIDRSNPSLLSGEVTQKTDLLVGYLMSCDRIRYRVKLTVCYSAFGLVFRVRVAAGGHPGEVLD